MKRLLALGVVLVIGCEVEVPEYKPVGKRMNLTQITSEKGMNILPDISCDGKWLCFSSNRRGNFDLFIKKPEEQAVIQRTFGRESDLFPSWSVDGQKLAFSSNRFGSFDIFVIDAFSGQDTRQITSDSSDEIAPDWSPDGKKIVFTKIRSERETSYSVVIVDCQTGLETELTDGLFPKFSPDGKKICFQRGIEDGRQSIWIINRDGSMETEVVYSPVFSAITPSWSSDGEKLIYASAVIGEGDGDKEGLIPELVAYQPIDLRVIKIDGSNDTQIIGDSGPDGFPTWSTDDLIYFCSIRSSIQNEGNINIFRMKLESLP